MYALAILRYRRPVEEVIVHQEAHRAYLRALKEAGLLLAAGPQEPRFGGILLLRVPDEDVQGSFDRIRDGDPYVSEGVAQYELIGWNVVLGREGLDAI